MGAPGAGFLAPNIGRRLARYGVRERPPVDVAAAEAHAKDGATGHRTHTATRTKQRPLRLNDLTLSHVLPSDSGTHATIQGVANWSDWASSRKSQVVRVELMNYLTIGEASVGKIER
jgi:hypothetical protein